MRLISSIFQDASIHRSTRGLEYECAVAVAVSRPLASQALLGEFGPVCNTPLSTTVIQIPHEVSFGVHSLH